MFFYNTELEVKDGKQMLHVTTNKKNMWLSVFLIMVLVVGSAILFTAYSEGNPEIFSIILGLGVGAVYGIVLRKERAAIMKRKKPDTNIVVKDERKRNEDYWIEVYE